MPATSWRLLRALSLARPGWLAAALGVGVLLAGAQALVPVAIGRAVDAALSGGSAAQAPPGAPVGGSLPAPLLVWVGVVLGLGLVTAGASGASEYLRTTGWIGVATDTLRGVTTHAARLGGAVTARIRTGEIVAIGSSDVYALGTAVEMIGPLAGAVVSYLVVGVLLVGLSPALGVVALLGAPLATVGLAPLLGPLRRRTEAHREQVGEATTLAGEIVAGLRVLRGVGGERRFAERFAATSQRVRRAGVAAGRIDAWLAGVEVFMPGLVTVAVTWLGARLALAGELSVGELVAGYALSAYLVLPVGTAVEAVHALGEALVAAARVTAVLALRPTLSSPADPTPLPPGAFGLVAPSTGLSCPAGALTVVRGCDDGGLADRLGRFVETPVLAVAPGLPAVPLAAAELAELRRRILVARHDDLLFTGPLADEVCVGDRVELDTALWAADAHDVPPGLSDGLDTVLTGGGRQLSGGQRQRLMLARALTHDPDVLVLDQPTGAVDAHTEARIAARVARLRRGRTTVVLGGGPLWAAVADHVVEPRAAEPRAEPRAGELRAEPRAEPRVVEEPG